MLRRLVAAIGVVLVTATTTWAALLPRQHPARGQIPLTRLVNPFIGAAGAGHTFPGADVPFGMVQWSPDTSPGGGAGYAYRDDTIQGFSLTHLSGVGCTAYQDFPFMPIIGDVSASPGVDGSLYRSIFFHTNEQAAPGYYGVTLGSGIRVQLTVTRRSGMAAITYPSAPHVTLLMNVAGSVGGNLDASVRILNRYQIVGSARGGGFCGHQNHYTVNFAAEFSRPFEMAGTWSGATVRRGATGAKGPRSGAYVTFAATHGLRLFVKVGLSYVSVQGARRNLLRENHGWDFNAVRGAADRSWNAMLNRVQVQGGSSQDRTTFYTALYHALLHPNVFGDSNGEYMGFDHHPHRATGYTPYANFSGWDIYRTEIPLLAMIAPGETSDMMQSLVAAGRESGAIPRFPLANEDTGMMVGDAPAPTIAGAYALGATHFDARTALAYLVRNATRAAPQPGIVGERPGLVPYLASGYVPALTPSPKEVDRTAATTLEYSVADFAIGQLAQALGDLRTAHAFAVRSQNWQNLFNPVTGFVQSRESSGVFRQDVGASTQAGYAEGNAAQYRWMVPHNLAGLFGALGGPGSAVALLDALFAHVDAGPAQPYAWLSNEPTLEAPWEYDFAGRPWRTQALVRTVTRELYAADPSGLRGDDDLGTLSAWYVWSALGFFPEIPGTDVLAFGSPLFPRVTIRLAHGVLNVTAAGAAPASPYIRSCQLNGRAYTRAWIPFSSLRGGGHLDCVVGPRPNTAWGAAPADVPPSFSTGEAPVLPFFAPSPGPMLTLTRGHLLTFTFGLRNITNTRQTVNWSARAVVSGTQSPAAALHVTHPRGSIRLLPSAIASCRLYVFVDLTATPGPYEIAIQTASTPDEHRLPPVIVPLSVR